MLSFMNTVTDTQKKTQQIDSYCCAPLWHYLYKLADNSVEGFFSLASLAYDTDWVLQCYSMKNSAYILSPS